MPLNPEAAVVDKENNGIVLPIVNYEPELSHAESLGAQARRLWEERFNETAEKAVQDSAFIHTGLGGAPGGNKDVRVKRFGDGSIVAPYYDLQKTLGQVPKVLFLSGSPLSAEHALNLISLARTYKEQGVETVIAVMTALPHERQDHVFPGKDGRPMKQVTTLKDVMRILALSLDGGLIVQPHSLRSVEFGLRYGFPLLPIDPFKMMMHGAKLNRNEPGLVIGPDKGRKDEGRMAASWLGWPMASATKSRNREGDGTPEVYIPPEALNYIKKRGCTVLVYDDEIREGGTIGGIARRLHGFTDKMIVCAVKAVCAIKQESDQEVTQDTESMTAIDHLRNPIIQRIVVTDAVQPLIDVAPIQHKLEVLPLEPELNSLVSFLQHNLVRPNDPNWLRNPVDTGTFLRLDLSIEHV